MPTKSNKLKVNRPINNIPGAHQRPSQESRGENSLRVIPILLPQPKQLTQEQLGPVKQRMPSSKSTKAIQPKRNLKKEKEEMLHWLNNVRIG